MVNKALSSIVLVMTVLVCHPAWGLAQQAQWKPPVFGETRATADSRPSSDSFSQMFRSFGTDLMHLPSRDTLTTLVIGGALAGLASTQDKEFSDYAPTAHTLEEALDGGAWTGSAFLQTGGAFVTYVVGRTTHKPRVVHVGSDLVRAQVLNAILTQSIKFATSDGRSVYRPTVWQAT